MGKHCPNCKSEISDSATVCPNCGKKLKSQNSIEGLLGIVIILGLFILLSFNRNQISDNDIVELERQDLGNINLLVPKGSAFIEYDTIHAGDNIWAIAYDNTLEDDSKLSDVWIANYNNTNITNQKLIENDGNLEVYQTILNKSYFVQKHVGNYYVTILGINDLDTMKKIADSIELKNETATDVNS